MSPVSFILIGVGILCVLGGIGSVVKKAAEKKRREMKVLAEEQAENRIFEHEVPPTKIGNESSNNNIRNSRNSIYEETDEEIETRFRQQYENMGKANHNKPKDFLSGYSRNKARVNPVQGDVPRAKAAPKKERRKSAPTKQDDYTIPEPPQMPSSSSDFPNSFDSRSRSSPPKAPDPKPKPAPKPKAQPQQERPKSAPPAKVVFLSDFSIRFHYFTRIYVRGAVNFVCCCIYVNR